MWHKPYWTPSEDEGSQNCEEVLRPRPHSRVLPVVFKHSWEERIFFKLNHILMRSSKRTLTNPSAPAFALVVPRQMKAESTLQRFWVKEAWDQSIVGYFQVLSFLSTTWNPSTIYVLIQPQYLIFKNICAYKDTLERRRNIHWVCQK